MITKTNQQHACLKREGQRRYWQAQHWQQYNIQIDVGAVIQPVAHNFLKMAISRPCPLSWPAPADSHFEENVCHGGPGNHPEEGGCPVCHWLR